MSKQMFEREYHSERRGRRLIDNAYDSSWDRQWGLQRYLAEVSSGGRYRKYTKYFLRNTTLVGQQDVLREMTMWEAEELDRKDIILRAKRDTKKGSLKAWRVKKFVRTLTNRNRRRLGARYCHESVYEREEEFYERYDSSHRESYGWYLW